MKKYLIISLVAVIFMAGCTRNQADNKETVPASDNSQAEEQANTEADSPQAAEPIIEVTNLMKRDDYQFVYEVNTDKSRVVWTGRRVDGTVHSGTIDLQDGQVFVKDGGDVVNALFVLDMTSIKENDGSRVVNHLLGEDFFDIETFPKSDLIVNKAEIKGKNENGDTIYAVGGKLKIKGISKEISFEAVGKLDTEAGTFRAEAEFSIDRTEWDVRYGSGKFFKSLGDKVIDDMIDYKIIIEAEKVKSQ